MSAEKWAGFTDEDIERINKCTPNDCDTCNDRICEINDLAVNSKKRGPMKIKKIPMKPKAEMYLEDDNALHNDLTADRLMSTVSGDNITFIKNEPDCTCDNYTCCDTQKELSSEDNKKDIVDEKCKDLGESDAHLLPLEVFELRQKRIETENARRRALITKAINDKKLRTQAEAVKLAKITQELSRIDSNLSADVNILRDYIEKASLEFSEAEKRYLKAEKEFVEAKLILFEKMQKKEMLTEHLCAIIEQNENRKADKLVELMKQLEMEVLLDEYQMNGIQPILPNLCALNDEAYQSCQTIKPTLSKGSSQHSVNSVGEKNEKTEQVGVVSENSTESLTGMSSEESAGLNDEKSDVSTLDTVEKSVIKEAEVGNTQP